MAREFRKAVWLGTYDDVGDGASSKLLAAEVQRSLTWRSLYSYGSQDKRFGAVKRYLNAV
ncbi:hypothetical protein Y023_5675 [Burkholderia pseudomallei A79D]|nr:hypothetical protein Y023_5675 [Burkholderia pseudomallei A79D]KGX95451.1 hypothetical protein X997_5517 [Burkholderia pseudomallei A79C]